MKGINVVVRMLIVGLIIGLAGSVADEKVSFKH